ncbi:MAG: dihydrouridine synthase [Nitratiruptor sp.]|nr:dihydrouridine synthase [Nitratiruptor sp.]NPA83313.1 dihydrouridine synthase [Campylobacterota bacterium]
MSWIDRLRIDRRLKEKIHEAIERRVRLRVEARLAENRLSMEDFTPEELEIIFADERLKLLDELKSKGIIALLAALGLSLF